jgi:hypothetical protein
LQSLLDRAKDELAEKEGEGRRSRMPVKQLLEGKCREERYKKDLRRRSGIGNETWGEEKEKESLNKEVGLRPPFFPLLSFLILLFGYNYSSKSVCLFYSYFLGQPSTRTRHSSLFTALYDLHWSRSDPEISSYNPQITICPLSLNEASALGRDDVYADVLGSEGEISCYILSRPSWTVNINRIRLCPWLTASGAQDQWLLQPLQLKCSRRIQQREWWSTVIL